MRRHSSAQRRQARAQALQWSMSCCSHSPEHASQISEQRAQIAAAFSLSRAMYPAARRQSCAQSMSRAMQRAIALGSSSARHAAAQWSQASAQALHASMQAA